MKKDRDPSLRLKPAIFANGCCDGAGGQAMPTRNVNLTDHFDASIDSGIETGRYGNASEVVREGLRLLERRDREDEAKIEWLRGAARDAIDAIERSEGTELETPEAIDRLIDDVAVEVAAGEHARRPRA